MAEKSFVMVSLKEDKAKKLTQTLSNEKCRKILDYLSTIKEATETQIAKELKLPISTVHYNLNLLSENKLVTKDEFHYSEKGKEVIHYKIANKYIIIAPNEDESFLEKLKSFIPAFVTVAVAAVGLFFFQMFSRSGASVMRAAPAAFDLAAESGATNTMQDEAVQMVAKSAPEVIVQTAPYAPSDIALWFFIGAIFAMLVFLFWQLVQTGKK